MAFDWTQVEGYREDMTADEKLALLENIAQPPKPITPTTPLDNPPTADPPTTPNPTTKLNGYIPKAQFDKVSSELAAAKKQLKSKMTEDEQREADRVAAEEAMKNELDALRHEKTLNGYKASYLSQGYDEQLADEAATAMADGDMDTVFAVMKKQAANMEKNLRAKILKDTPVPPAGDDPADAKKQKEMAELRAVFGLPPVK